MNRKIALIFILVFLTRQVCGDEAPLALERKGETTEIRTEETHEEETESRSIHLYPANSGSVGIFRVRSAESLPTGALAFGIGGEFYSVTNSTVAQVGNSNADTLAESLFVGFAPIENFTISLQRRNSSTTFGAPANLISSLGDFTFSFLYSLRINDLMSIAPFADFVVASNFNNLAPSGQTLSAGLGLAYTLSFFKWTSLPLYLHANLKYNMPEIRTSKFTTVIEPEAYFGFSRFHTVSFGLGGELRLGDFIPFIEFFDTIQASSGLSFGANPSKISIGTRITPLENKSLAFLVGADVGLGKGVAVGVPFSPDYQILGQVSYTVGITSTERKHYKTSKSVNIVDRKFVISENIRFKVNQAVLEPSSYPLLDEIAEVVKQNNIKKLLIVGHTDSSASGNYNLKLSQKRAAAVKTYLASKGIPADEMITQGYGKTRPKASNLTEEGRAKNRRVEFFILE